MTCAHFTRVGGLAPRGTSCNYDQEMDRPVQDLGTMGENIIIFKNSSVKRLTRRSDPLSM